ncbi:MAG: leucyl aminopeptidase, partial [Roseateles sp.]
VLGPPEMARLGMGALLAVARGSREPPRLIAVEYRGAPGGGAPLVLVGKGITFDAGGLSLKAAADMEEMKFDMCGAASVLGALQAAAVLRLPINVVALVPAAENMPGGNALKPGDVVTTLSGLSVEVVDTDSEGRLALADALTYARRYEPAAVIDVATLTGAIVGALGPVASGLFANDERLAHALRQAGDRAWDRAWAMPLWEEYHAPLKSPVADLPNIGARDDCAGIAAAFLSRFTEGLPWAHLDIAGTASTPAPQPLATGRPVGLLVHFMAGWANGRSAAQAG